MPKRYTVTAALPYTNGPIHIGHLAGVYIPADIYSRYLREQGKDVAFICGSDEHGVAIALKAKKEGKTPQQIIDQYDQLIRESFNSFGIAFDHYSRTSRKIHHETAQEFFKILYDKGVFEEKDSTVSGTVVDKINYQDIMHLIQELPKNTRFVFNMHVMEGFSHKEISDELNISEGTSKWHLHEARKILKDKITKLNK